MARQTDYQRRYYRLIALYWLFQKGTIPAHGDQEQTELEKEENQFSRIRCPLCRWQPNAGSRWCCASWGYPEYFYEGCGTLWNTFSTRGRCPGCQHQWRWTSCLSCHGWSLHEDWYSNETD